MADPTKYTPGYDFSDYQAQAPASPLPGTRVDIELQNISQSVSTLVDAVKNVRRSDGKLANQSVGPDQLSPALSIGFTNEGTWAEDVSYSSGDGVFYEQTLYSSRLAHTATALNRPDLDPTTWNFLFSIADFVIPDDSVSGDKLLEGAVGERELADSALDGDKIDIVVAGSAWLKARDYATVSEFLADDGAGPKGMGYAGSGASVTVTAGTIVTAQGFRYEVVAEGDEAPDEETAGGVKLKVATESDWSVINRALLARVNNKIMDPTGSQAIKIVCIGDSMTYGHDTVSADKIPPAPGHGFTRAAVQYPARLESRLNSLINATVTVENRGFSGDTARQSFVRWTDNPGADLAIIMLGINDSDGVHGATFEQYVEFLGRLVQRYLRWGSAVLIATPTCIVGGAANNPSTRYGQAARSIAQMSGCPVFESENETVYALFSDVYSDGTHFNSTGYAKYADALASFLLSGALVRSQPRKIASETIMQSGRQSEGLGCHTFGNVILVSNPGSHARNDHVAVIQDGGVASFSFYLDAEAADVIATIVLPVGGGTIISMCSPYMGKGQNYGLLDYTSGRLIKETSPYPIISSDGEGGPGAFLGSLVGRGWKTIEISGASAGECYLNAVTVVPKLQKDASVDNSFLTPAAHETYIRSLPSPLAGDASSLPDPVSVTSIILPYPDALLSWSGNRTFYAFGGTLKIRQRVMAPSGAGTPNPAGVAEYILSRVGVGSGDIALDKIFETAPGMHLPTGISAWTSPVMDREVTMADLTPLTGPGGGPNVWLTLDFAAGFQPAYYHFEVESLVRRGAAVTRLN